MSLSNDVLLGDSALMDTVRMDVALAARTSVRVLITGETGVGKAVVAHRIHDEGRRRHEPFVRFNCQHMRDAVLASELGHIHRGTLFLEAVGEMSLAMQAMFLNFLDARAPGAAADAASGGADVGVVAATHRDLHAGSSARGFRDDLYYRLNVIHIVIPPLREHSGDVVLLLRHHLRQASAAHRVPCPRFTPDAERQLTAYAWPGNVSELRRMTERIVLRSLSRPVTPDDLPDEVCAGLMGAARGFDLPSDSLPESEAPS